MTSAKQALQQKTNAAPASQNSKSIKDLIVLMKPQIEKALPSVITPERFSRMMLTAISNNKSLQECTAESFLGAMMNAAQLGLEPNTPLGQAYLIPYKNTKRNIMECQFQIGYKGLIDLSHRSGEFASIYAHAVHENDEFSFSLGLDATLVHKPKLNDRGKVIAYYAVYKLVNGGYAFEIMSKEDAREHAYRYSQSYKKNFGPWVDNFDEMAKKTVLKKLLKYAPIKTEFVRHMAEDETVKSSIAEDMSEVNNEMETIDISSNEEQVDPATGEVLMDGMTSYEVDAMLAENE